MIVKARIEHQKDFLFMEEIPDKYVLDHRLSEKSITIKDAPVGIKNYQLSTNGLFLVHSEMKFDGPARILTEVEGEAITCQFIFSNKNGSDASGKQSAKYGLSRHNIRYIPSAKEAYDVKPDVEFVYFLIVLSKDYYLRLVDLYSPLHEQFVQEIEKGISTSFAEHDLFMTPEMRRSIEAIVTCRQDGELKRLFTDARITELIMYQLEQFSQHIQGGKEALLDRDIPKLEEAREILERDYIDPPTHKQLSKMILLNEFKLRTGFKKYFGSTIYDFVTRLRMEEAKRLILEEGKNMYEVGVNIGFKHQASFTNAFKKYYGILPSDVRL
ncbi:helix-turn-helix transcriptional regulator [Pedobacter alluvionis]|uniref:AraC family transcriptional regulator n=1 Tax=Pedobacter alluvionis TaxID=475253 RepID=A0A497Y0E6_9SPHI|nr:AraC family transcriptional regulator [Pedobacter alluvionis]RLJ75065.1 AraC-like DNA-binding protein [Pedobacter alluvionis]TFB30175.1 AraC family transcriptional regulator [Pedobacter alluvionis]